MAISKKIFGWLMALMLILACAPAAATPVPTLDSNAINLYIAQTANVASTQTVQAIPPTATFTLTPRSTFTPWSTPTPYQTFMLPTASPMIRSQFFRVKHDSQLAIYNYKSRTAENWGGGRQTPEVVQMYIEPSDKSGTVRTDLSEGSWEAYMNSLNDNDQKKLNYLKAYNTALFNNTGFPQLESLTMGGNVVSISQVQGGWGKVFTLNYVNPGSLKEINYITRPDLVHKFVVVAWDKSSKTTFWKNPPQGSTYWPLVASRAVWIPLDRLEPFPTLPMTVIANTEQEIKVSPGSSSESSGHVLKEGTSATIVEYYPSGSSVWARMDNGGWIVLFQYKDGGKKYPTNWSMATVPPPP